MIEAVGQVLGFAVGVAISPVPIIAVILMLFSAKAGSNSIAFAFGWVAGLSVVCAIVLVVGLGGPGDEDGGGWVKVVIGVLFLALALKQWRQRPGPGDDPAMPAWMAAIDDFDVGKALGLGVLMSALNPKNLGLTIAAATTIEGTGLTGSDAAVVAGVYVLLASVTILVPVVGYLVATGWMAPRLDSAKGWLMANNATVMAVLLLVLGAKVLGDGLSAVAG